MKILLFTILVLTGLSVGCVSVTTVKDEPRKSVLFASQKAAETFYRTYLADTHTARGSFNVFIPPPYWRYKVPSENVQFNDAIRRADRNSDGIISEKEANAYSAEVTHRIASFRP